MGNMGKFTASDLKNLQKQLNKIKDGNVDAFVESCAKELAARLLVKVIKRTPVRKPEDCPPGVKGGTLRRGWTAKTHEEAESGSWKSDSLAKSKGTAYADSLSIKHGGNELIIEIVNPVEYASYVEYGHRTPNHKGWVQGCFMLTISEQELQEIAPKVLEAKIKKFLEECLK